MPVHCQIFAPVPRISRIFTSATGRFSRLPRRFPRGLPSSRGLTITGEWIMSHCQKHVKPSGKVGLNLPLNEGGFSLIPEMRRNPDSVTVDDRGRIALHLDTLDGGTLTLGVAPLTGRPRTFSKQKTQETESAPERNHAMSDCDDNSGAFSRMPGTSVRGAIVPTPAKVNRRPFLNCVRSPALDI